VLVGEPVAVDDLLAQAAQQGWGEERLQVAIADRVGQVGGSAVKGQGGAGSEEAGGKTAVLRPAILRCLFSVFSHCAVSRPPSF
jgi:hypothetical protein